MPQDDHDEHSSPWPWVMYTCRCTPSGVHLHKSKFQAKNVFRRVLEDFILSVVFLHEVTKLHRFPFVFLKRTSKFSEVKISWNPITELWKQKFVPEMVSFEQVSGAPLFHVYSMNSTTIKSERGKCVIYLYCNFTQWTCLRSSPPLAPLPTSTWVEKRSPSVYGVGDFTATLAHLRSKGKRGMESKETFHLVPPLISFQSADLREAFPPLHCCPSL